MKLLNGSELAGFIKERHAGQVRVLRSRKIFPKLAIVQLKDDPVINTYVRLKREYGADIGIEVDIHTPTPEETPKLLDMLSNSEDVHGIIVQLPLPDQSKTDEIVNMVPPWKDVDALRDPSAPWPPSNQKPGDAYLDVAQGSSEERSKRYREVPRKSTGADDTAIRQEPASMPGFARQQGKALGEPWFEPATPMAILWLLAGYNINLMGRKVLLIGRGKLVGEPLEKILRASDVKVSVATKETSNLKSLAQEADVIIAAANEPEILSPDMIKEAAVVVDAGVAGEEGKTVGNLTDDVYQRGDITVTPQKGGVGPLTVCALFENVIRAAENNVQ